MCSCKKLFKLSCYADALSAPKRGIISFDIIFISKIELYWLNEDEEIDKVEFF